MPLGNQLQQQHQPKQISHQPPQNIQRPIVRQMEVPVPLLSSQQTTNNAISSPICSPSTAFSLVSIQQNQHQPQNRLNNLNQNNNNNNKPLSVRQSFQNRSGPDRKPEELDAIANELLNEFSLSNNKPLIEMNIKNTHNQSDSSEDEYENANLRDDGTLPVSNPSSKPLSL